MAWNPPLFTLCGEVGEGLWGLAPPLHAWVGQLTPLVVATPLPKRPSFLSLPLPPSAALRRTPALCQAPGTR